MAKYLISVLFLSISIQLRCQESEFNTMVCHDSKNRLAVFNTGFYKSLFHNGKLISLVTLDSSFSYDNKKRTISIKQAGVTNIITVWKKKGIYLSLKDTIYRLDSLQLLTATGNRDSMPVSTFVKIQFDSIEVIVFYNKLRLESVVFPINGKVYVVDFYFNQKDVFIEQIKEINQYNEFYLIFRYLHPVMIFYQNRLTNKTIDLAANNRGRFYIVTTDRSYRRGDTITNELSRTLYYYNCWGRLKKKYSSGKILYCK